MNKTKLNKIIASVKQEIEIVREVENGFYIRPIDQSENGWYHLYWKLTGLGLYSPDTMSPTETRKAIKRGSVLLTEEPFTHLKYVRTSLL